MGKQSVGLLFCLSEKFPISIARRHHGVPVLC